MNKSNHTIPWRTILLFTSVTAIIIVSFVIWNEPIDSFLKTTIENAHSNILIIALVLFFILSSDILLPIPSSLASTLCGLFLGPWLGFLVSFFAMELSAAIGYFIGMKASNAAKKLVGENDMNAINKIHECFGPSILLSLRPVPVLAETSLIFAGLANIPILRTTIFVTIGNAIVSLIYVITGAYFSKEDENTTIAFLSCAAISAIFMATRYFYKTKQYSHPNK